jgi:putative toxin-antitoxin system antitoxin component (TIGR02293 family)
VQQIDRLVRLAAHAIAVFGDQGKASHWVTMPLPLLDHRSPEEVIFGEGDFERIDQILTRIEHNIPS